MLDQIIQRNFGYIIIDRTPFTASNDDLLTVQRVPSAIYDASYSSWIFATEKFCRVFPEHYSLVGDFPANDGVIKSGKIVAHYRGFIFKRIN